MKKALFLACLIAIVLTCLHRYFLPLVGEETRYASVAWRMFMEHQWFLPQWGNHVYLQKTPLLFWCLDIGWWIKRDWPWPMIIPLIFSLLTIFYTQKLSQILFSDKAAIALLSPLVLISMPFFINQLGLLRFDMMLTLFNVMACYYLIKKRYGLFVLSNGLGLLAKGPVIYLFTLPEVFLFCFYLTHQSKQEVIKWLIGIMISMSALMVWWAPLLYQGKFTIIKTVLLEQIVARTMGSMSVAKPIWDYLPLLPCFFLPWIVYPSFLRYKARSEHDKKVERYLIQVFLVCFMLFSFIKTKESRYLLPLAPLVAIFMAARLEKLKKVFFFMILSISITTAIDLSVTHARLKTQDLLPAVTFINTLFAKNISVVSRDPAMSDLQFTGQWQQPLPVRVREDKFCAWAMAHPHGWVITSVQQKSKQAYAVIVNECFEQSYSHLDRVLQICPIHSCQA